MSRRLPTIAAAAAIALSVLGCASATIEKSAAGVRSPEERTQ